MLMRSIPRTGTAPERAARTLARLSGLRYRLNASGLPGSPDLVFPTERVAVFVHGCFWHRHSCPRGRRVPAVNVAFWTDKFANNVRRDRDVVRRLRELGWEVVIMWECEL